MIDEQKLFILGEFYFKKGNLSGAKEIFSKLAQNAPTSFPFPYFLGKIEFNSGNFDEAIAQLEITRTLNPFHKQTLLLLSQAYEKTQQLPQALECMVDSYLLCKETKDERLEIYKKKIRDLAKQMPGMHDLQKNKLIKDRLHTLHIQLQKLEKMMLQGEPVDLGETMPEIQTHDLNIEMMEDEPLSPVTLDEEHGLEEPEEGFELVDQEREKPEEKHHEQESDEDDLAMPEVPNNVVSHDFKSNLPSDIDFTQMILFKSLSVQEIEKISKFSTVYTYEKDEMIHQALEPIYGFSCVLKGKIQVLHQGKELLVLESGAIIDEAELCNGSKYFFESRALEKTSILLINKAGLLTLCKRKHELAVHFLWHFYKSLSLKISAIIESILLENPSQDMTWSMERMKEISQQRVLNELELEFLTRQCKKLIHSKGAFLFKEHQPTEFLYILLEGEIELQHSLAKDWMTIRPGEVFSEIALISGSFEHTMRAKVTSDHAVLLQITRSELTQLHDPTKGDNYRMMEFLWNVFSKKYFEFLNFYHHILKA